LTTGLLGHHLKDPGPVLRSLVWSHTVGALELGEVAGAERGDVAQGAVARDDERGDAFGSSVTSDRVTSVLSFA